jgi:hypothetical protein
VGEPKIPVFLAVGLWSASALAVITYTAIAFKKTATGLDEAVLIAGSPLVASPALLAAEGAGNAVVPKPLNRNKFTPSH